MSETAEKQAQPSLASIREEQTAKEIYAAVREWVKAGKPHKR